MSNPEKRVLVVEDSPELRDILKEIIIREYPQYIVDVSENERNATTRLAINNEQNNNEKYDFIIIDIKLNDYEEHLDDFGGLRILDYINKHSIQANVVVVTAHASSLVPMPNGDKVNVREYAQQYSACSFLDRMELGQSYYDELLNSLEAA